MSRFATILLSMFALLVSACGSSSDDGKGPVVLAAVSLQNALEAVSAEWVKEGHRAPVMSFAATSALARQIEAGAPADLFISADEKWMNEVEGKGLVWPGSRVDLVGNNLVLIAPARSNVALVIEKGFALDEALGSGRLAMADPDSVPAGRYGKESLVNLGVWDSIVGKVVPAENVRAALALVGRGEVPLGIVYSTDAKADADVRVVATFPEETHDPIRYPAAMLAASGHEDAVAFRDFLFSAKAAAIFTQYGFTPLTNKQTPNSVAGE